MIVDGLLLCSECENQLQVSEYEGEYGFFAVKPCVHCATHQIVQDEDLSDEKVAEVFLTNPSA